jgi:hypothetical protein
MTAIMALSKRSSRAPNGEGSNSASRAPPSDAAVDDDLFKKAAGGARAMLAVVKLFVAIGLVVGVGGYAMFGRDFFSAAGPEDFFVASVGSIKATSPKKPISDGKAGNGGGTARRDETLVIDGNVKLHIEFSLPSQAVVAKSEQSAISLGPHRLTLEAPTSSSPTSGVWIRAEGDALVTVLLTQDGDTWTGSLSFPVAGTYDLVAYWRETDGKPDDTNRILTKDIVVEGDIPTSGVMTPSSYPNAAWLSSKKFNYAGTKPPFIWHDPLIATADAKLIKTSASLVSKDSATFAASGFYSFSKLSNYELVCWVGSKSAEDSRLAFLEERSEIAPHQRTFKFHIYPVSNFEQPDRDWPENEKTRFRKCKHIFVSVDEIGTPLTQKEYKDQVTTFINHLLNAFPDETFPIWMLTVTESPRSATNCQPPYYLPRTSDHPCNDVLRDLFNGDNVGGSQGGSLFPQRVHLMDNTAISLPQLGENRDDVIAAIALRIIVEVGKKVGEWRESGQIGLIDGLHRADKVEPNFALVPYEGWK